MAVALATNPADDRWAPGVSWHSSTPEERDEAYRLYRHKGWSIPELAGFFGVTQQCVRGWVQVRAMREINATHRHGKTVGAASAARAVIRAGRGRIRAA